MLLYTNHVIISLAGHHVYRYDSNFFKALYHCEGDKHARTGPDNSEANPAVDPSFQSGGGLWSGNCGSANAAQIYNANPSNRIVGGTETVKHQYPWMVC